VGEPVYLFGSLRGHWVAFVLFSAISIFCGYAVSRILRGLAAPVGEPSYYGTTPGARRAIGAVLAAALLGLVWCWLWSGFHELRIAETSISLRYHVPPRERVVPRTAVAGVRWEPGPKLSRVLVITTRDGRRFSSMLTTLPDADAQKTVQAIARDLGL